MQATTDHLLTSRELAHRWGRTESAISLVSALGVGPRYLKIDGALKYPMQEVKRYEEACLLRDPSEAILQCIN